jgi:hypothetical protein
MQSSRRSAHDRDPDPERPEQPDEPEPANRAERRAHGKRSAQPPAPTKVQPTHRRDVAQQRQWTNRRAG